MRSNAQNAQEQPRKFGPDGKRICGIPSCGKRHEWYGYCDAHGARFKRHGDPLGGRTARGAAKKFFEEVVVPFRGNECLAWPFGNNGKGYGTYHIGRRAVPVCTVACERRHGPKPSPDHEVAHNCGKGHLLCCNPNHLRWATRSENHADKKKHGTSLDGEKNPQAVLTSEQVKVIRGLIGTAPQWRIAKQFGVSQMIISKIKRGLVWQSIP